MTEERLDEILNAMREEVAPAEQVEAARNRVWERLTGTPSAACAEFRLDLEEYQAGRLTPARRLLVDDHLGRCADCRRVYAEGRGEPQVIAMPRPRVSRFAGWTRWAVAAGVALTALFLGRDQMDRALAPSGPRATVVSVTGELYRPSAGSLNPGATLNENELVRTGADSRAVLQLADGSQVELNQRTELAVQAAWSGQTVRLDRGDVIVQAAKQRRGHLRVITRDSVASVKGTVFAVSSGAAGSLVSVVEGSVAVSQPGTEKLLTAGKQAGTSRALDQVKVRQAVAWSANAEKYFSLLAELATIEKQLAELAPTGTRTEAKLLRYLPAGTRVYFAIPNLDGTLRQAVRLVEHRSQENSTLAEWWRSDEGKKLKEMLDRLQAITPLLGDEVVVVLNRTGDNVPLIMAQIQPGRHDALKLALERLVEGTSEKLPHRISTDLLLISDSEAHLNLMASQLGGGATSPFAMEIAARYQRGVNWLAGIDCASLQDVTPEVGSNQLLGLLNMRYVFFEQRTSGGHDENEATLAFQGARKGIASWLGEQGPIGSTEYVSGEAVTAFAVSTKDPRQALDELLSTVGELGANAREFEREAGVSITNDIASSLGTDFSIAIERPTLPIPGWVGVFEVIRPAVLDDAVRKLVDTHNRHLKPEEANRKAVFTQETVDGRAWNSVTAGGSPVTLHWTYDRGYLVASTDRALAARAITVRDSGSSLARSMTFRERFPAGNTPHHSGFFWFNSKGVLADIAALVENAALKSLLSSRDPILVVLDGETERIRVSSRTRLTSLLLDAMVFQGMGDAQLPIHR